MRVSNQRNQHLIDFGSSLVRLINANQCPYKEQLIQYAMEEIPKNFPEHVKVYVHPNSAWDCVDLFKELGFVYTPFQIRRVGQIFGGVKFSHFQEIPIEIHIRVYHNGKITAEFEHKRIKSIKKHLFTNSYSAHEYVVTQLEIYDIDYLIDERIRSMYNKYCPQTFAATKFKIFKWLFIESLLITPVGVLWRTLYTLSRPRALFRKKKVFTSSEHRERNNLNLTQNS